MKPKPYIWGDHKKTVPYNFSLMCMGRILQIIFFWDTVFSLSVSYLLTCHLPKIFYCVIIYKERS